MDRSSKAACLFLGLFSLPFCAIGMLATEQGIREIVNTRSPQPGTLVTFGLMFSLIGFAFFAAAILAPRKQKQAQQRQAAHPQEPWLWREDWAQRRANSQTRSELKRAWIFSVLWCLASAPILFLVPAQKLLQQPASLVALGFPMVGAALLVWAIRETLRWFEFGKTSFEMNTLPFAIGGEVRGTIQTRFPRPPAHGILLKLTCVNCIVTGLGNSQSTQEKIVWRDEKTVGAEELMPGPEGATIPVSFQVPLDARPTDTTSPRDTILWKLETDADVPGVDYKDVFELPVFRTKGAPSEEPRIANSADLRPPARPTVVVRPAADGATEFYFPPARNPGFAAGLSGFVVLWSAFLWLMLAKGAPFIFPLLFGLFELLLIYGALQLRLGTSTVVMGAQQVQVRSGLLGTGRWQGIAGADVVRIQTAITAQQGGASGTPYYDVQLVRNDGTLVTLGRTMRDKHEAEYLATEMQRMIAPHAVAAFRGR